LAQEQTDIGLSDAMPLAALFSADHCLELNRPYP
jgi:hypothetical protein